MSNEQLKTYVDEHILQLKGDPEEKGRGLHPDPLGNLLSPYQVAYWLLHWPFATNLCHGLFELLSEPPPVLAGSRPPSHRSVDARKKTERGGSPGKFASR